MTSNLTLEEICNKFMVTSSIPSDDVSKIAQNALSLVCDGVLFGILLAVKVNRFGNTIFSWLRVSGYESWINDMVYKEVYGFVPTDLTTTTNNISEVSPAAANISNAFNVYYGKKIGHSVQVYRVIINLQISKGAMKIMFFIQQIIIKRQGGNVFIKVVFLCDD